MVHPVSSGDANGHLKAEADAGNTITATYIWGKDRLLIKQLASGAQYYYLYNGHGDVVQITDSAGNIVNSYEYDEWGNITSQTEGIENEFKYAGQTYDSETGLYYLRARYYDPGIGRFISKDTNEGDITNPLTLNLYVYAYNNPLIYIDPSGNIGIRQIDNFALGLLASGIEGITDLIELPTAAREISKAITQGSINLNDLAKAIGSSATEPIKYLIKQSQNVWLGKPSDAEVYQYAKHLGNIIQMAYGNGGKALSMISKASPGLMKIVSKGVGKSLNNSARMTTNKALDAASDFLGPGYKDMGNGRFVSADGKRQVRMGDSDILGQHGGGPHMNFETMVPNPAKPGKMMPDPKQNIHIFLED